MGDDERMGVDEEAGHMPDGSDGVELLAEDLRDKMLRDRWSDYNRGVADRLMVAIEELKAMPEGAEREAMLVRFRALLDGLEEKKDVGR